MGAMKSLAYDYALYLQQQAREADDLDFDIDETFRQIVNSELEIPQSFVDMWVSNNSVFASEDVVFDAETNSWKQQKRDSTGRFSKGFSDKTDSQLNNEYDDMVEEDQEKQSYYIDAANEESIYNEMIAPYYQYTDLDDYTPMAADVFSEFLEASIKDEEFPERLTDPYFYQYLQKVAESVPTGLLEQLREILDLQMNVGHQTGERDMEIIGGRGVFVADILLNIKMGQEMWAAETFESNQAVNAFWNACHDKSFSVLGRKIYYNCRLFASISSGVGVVSNPEGFYDSGYSKLRYTDVVRGKPLEAMVSISNQQKPSSVGDWYQVIDQTNEKLGSWRANAEGEDSYTEAEINLMRYDLVEHELENADYNYLYEVMLYGTTGWANLSTEDVIQQFKNIFER